tara:strand:+ start:193 stop:774 length:582 start_codon:yes stop_codon:yes gene_type:complete
LREIIFFSGNEGKITEIKNKFKNKQIKILSLKNFDNYTEPLENGLTFRDNAKIKSSYGYSKFNIPCFADDSGICIEALGNLPGVKSKDFLNSFKNNISCFEYIINEVKNKNNNSAFFKSVICLTLTNNKNIFFEGIINGKISDSIIGNEGFGFDPIFIPDGHNKTFAQMKIDMKNKISHRGIALEHLVKYFFN